MVETSQHLQVWKDKAFQDQAAALYMLKYYGVTPFPPSRNAAGNAVKTVLDSLLNAFEEKPVPPHTLVVFLDDNAFWCDDQLMSQAKIKDKPMYRVLSAMMLEIRRIIEKRIRQLPIKCVPEYTTRIFITKLTFRPDDADGTPKNFRVKRRDFNKLLDSIAEDKDVRTINLDEITPKVDSTFFLAHGALSNKGYNQIWLSLNNAIEDYDLHGGQRPKKFIPQETAPEELEQYYTRPGNNQTSYDADASSEDKLDHVSHNVKSVVVSTNNTLHHKPKFFNRKQRGGQHRSNAWRGRNRGYNKTWKNHYY